jgi:hypothetical protein
MLMDLAPRLNLMKSPAAAMKGQTRMIGPTSCPARGAAFFTMRRRAGTNDDAV